MSQYLLDVNVLLALAWPAHQSHPTARGWFDKYVHHGWATCALTEVGFVRMLSNPAFTTDAIPPAGAVKALEALLQSRFHHFWPSDISFAEAVRPFRQGIVGHLQVSDAYLLGLAIHKGGKLATLDRRILSLLPQDSPARQAVELVDPTLQ